MSIENVKNCTLFDKVDNDYREALLSHCHEVELKKDAYLFHQGETGNGMYFIVSGKIEVVAEKRQESDGHDTEVLTELEAGDYLGEICMLKEQARTAAARAKSDCVLFYYESDQFQHDIAKGNPGAMRVGYNIAQILADRLRFAIELIMTLKNSYQNAETKSELEELKEQLMSESLF